MFILCHFSIFTPRGETGHCCLVYHRYIYLMTWKHLNGDIVRMIATLWALSAPGPRCLTAHSLSLSLPCTASVVLTRPGNVLISRQDSSLQIFSSRAMHLISPPWAVCFLLSKNKHWSSPLSPSLASNRHEDHPKALKIGPDLLFTSIYTNFVNIRSWKVPVSQSVIIPPRVFTIYSSLCFRRSSWCSSACCWRWSCLATPWCSSRSSRPGPGGQGWISSSCTWPWPTSAWGCSPCPRTSCGRWPWPGRPGCWPASSSGSYRWSSPTLRPTSWWRSASTDMTPSPTPWPSLAAVSVGLSLIPLTSHPTASSARLDSDDQQLAQMAQSREQQLLSVLLLTRLEDKWDWYLNFREAGQVVGSQCLVSLHPVLCADHLPLQHRGAGDGARAGCPVLDQLPWAVALEALHDAGLHQPLLHPRRHHRHLLRRHRGHHLAEGADHGHS